MSVALARKAFFALLAAAAASLGIADNAPLDENLVALFADLHVTPDPAVTHQREGFAQRVREVLALNPRPANVLFYGDLSLNVGQTNDYRVLKELVKPLEEAGVRWHACFGNHDRRAAFFAVFPERRGETPPVPNRLVTLVATPHADFILLDSSREGPVSGEIDDAQRAWLSRTLARASKPVFVGAHHSIKETGVTNAMAATALCKAYIYGHDHTWKQQRVQGVETLCLPSTGHWGDIGYVLVKLSADEAVFTIRQSDCYAPRPAAKPEDVKAEWRQRVQRNDGSQWRIPFNK
jgi:hypothetical protein